MGFRIGIWVRDWEWGLEFGIGNLDMELGLMIEIRDWDWGLRLGIGNWELEFGIGIVD